MRAARRASSSPPWVAPRTSRHWPPVSPGQSATLHERLAYVAGDIGEPFVQRRGLAPRVAAEELDVSAAGADEAEDDPDRRRLARSVGAEEAVDLSGGHLEVEPIEGTDRAEGLGQPLGADDGLGRTHGVLLLPRSTERALGAAIGDEVAMVTSRAWRRCRHWVWLRRRLGRRR